MTTNELAKQAAIIKAWGIAYNPRVDTSGWFDLMFCDEVPPIIDFIRANPCRMEFNRIRPKSLDGIEDNNGWTRINSDGSNLPEEVAYYEVCINGIPWGHPQPLQFLVRTFYSVAKEQLTHFRKWEPSKPPIY